MSIDRWVDNMVYAIEYRSAIKCKATLPFATIWINLEDIMVATEGQIIPCIQGM